MSKRFFAQIIWLYHHKMPEGFDDQGFAFRGARRGDAVVAFRLVIALFDRQAVLIDIEQGNLEIQK